MLPGGGWVCKGIIVWCAINLIVCFVCQCVLWLVLLDSARRQGTLGGSMNRRALRLCPIVLLVM